IALVFADVSFQRAHEGAETRLMGGALIGRFSRRVDIAEVFDGDIQRLAWRSAFGAGEPHIHDKADKAEEKKGDQAPTTSTDCGPPRSGDRLRLCSRSARYCPKPPGGNMLPVGGSVLAAPRIDAGGPSLRVRTGGNSNEPQALLRARCLLAGAAHRARGGRGA